MRSLILVALYLSFIGALFAAPVLYPTIPPVGHNNGEKKKICLNMIVKNESKVIERCLRSTLPIIDYWVIVDTGSTDGTQEIIRKFMKDIPGELHERPWVNFAHNRNEALQFAKNKGDFLLFIDADEELKYEENFSLPVLDKDCYAFRIKFDGISYTRIQLINNNLDWKWEGVLHETIKCPESKSSDEFAGIINSVKREGCRSQDPETFTKDAKILEEALLQDPSNSRYVFYLAITYNNAKNYEKALEKFQKRVAMGGCEQEVFWSLYAIGRMQEFLNCDLETITKSYCNAYLFRPIRAEPLYRLAHLYRTRGNPLLGSIFASLGKDLPIPKYEAMLVESWVYDYALLLEYCASAFLLGKYDECLDICDLLLSRPAVPENLRKSIEDDKKIVLMKMPIRFEIKNENVR